MKCDNCLHSRRIISENGMHSVCCLSEKEAMECKTKNKDHSICTMETYEDSFVNGYEKLSQSEVIKSLDNYFEKR